MKFHENRGSFKMKLIIRVVINSIIGIKIFNLYFKTWSCSNFLNLEPLQTNETVIRKKTHPKSHLAVKLLNLAHMQRWVFQLARKDAIRIRKMGSLISIHTFKSKKNVNLYWGSLRLMNLLPSRADKNWFWQNLTLKPTSRLSQET